MPQTPTPPDRPDAARSRWVGLAALGCAAAIAIVVTLGIFLPAIGVIVEQARTPVTLDPSTLPAQVLVCDREYARADTPVPMTLDEVRARDGRDPIVVSGVPVPGCPDGTCVEGGMCVTAIYVSAGTDRYVSYELQGGP